MSQGSTVPLGTETYHYMDRLDIKYSKIQPLSFMADKPLWRPKVGEYAENLALSNLSFNKVEQYQIEYLMKDNNEWLDSLDMMSKKPFIKVLYTRPDAFYSYQSKNEVFTFKINPVLHLNVGAETNGAGLKFINTRGVELRFNLKKTVGFYTYFTDNQMRNANYVGQFIQEEEAVPGEGFYKNLSNNGADFFTARGYVDFTVLDHLYFKFGYDKNFIGNGYRSMFLSDFSNSMLFLQFNIKVWRMNYQSIFAEMTQQYTRGADQLLPKKYAAFHHLNFSFTHWLDIGFFEGVIFNRDGQFELHYLNPIIFYRSIESDLGSADNSVLGMDFKANMFGTTQLYGQFLLDEFNYQEIRQNDGWWGNKFGWQLGFKYIDIFGLKNVDVQLEYNGARPYTYTHRTTANYTSYNQALAHPAGANFQEFIFIGRWQPIPKLRTSIKYFFISQGADSSGSNWGGDIFFPNVDASGGLTVEQEYGNKIGQGVKQRTHMINFRATYTVFHNFYLDLEIVYRNLNSELNGRDLNTFFFTTGLRWNLPFRNFDF